MSKPGRLQQILLGIIVVLVAIVGILLLRLTSSADTAGVQQADAAVEKNEDFISIPGFEMLELEADTKKQTVSLANPPQNTCYFQITLCLEDGTELWTSDLIKPGKTSKPIVLEESLAAGTYTGAVLRYACFRMDANRTPLNGAETKLTLLVK